MLSHSKHLGNPPPPRGAVSAHIDWLDGLRGFAALWVLLSHVQILVGMQPIPVLSWGGLAVDLFMMLSGFLMAHHYLQRAEVEPWQHPNTALVFWVRRFFRIAPLYYLLLLTVLIIGPWLGEYRTSIAAVWPWTATPLERYTDQSLDNALMHVSFLFGATPFYAFRTALPDWSIGLEMQFYLMFPLLMLMIAWIGPIRAGLGAIFACLAVQWFFPGFSHAFQMPSFLPLKLYVFFIGIWLALGRHHGTMRAMLLVALLVAGFWARRFQGESIARVFMVIMMFYLMDGSASLPLSGVLSRYLERLRSALARPSGKFLGETSYAVYLLHLAVVLPVAGTLAQQAWYVRESPWIRFTVCALITFTIVYPISWQLYSTVERRGIQWGKRAVARMRRRVPAVGTDAV